MINWRRHKTGLAWVIVRGVEDGELGAGVSVVKQEWWVCGVEDLVAM
jgi:hypothetical protein